MPKGNSVIVGWMAELRYKNAISGIFFSNGPTAPSGPRPHTRGFLIILRHTTLCRTPLEECLGRSQRPLPGNTQHSHVRRDSNQQSQQGSAETSTWQHTTLTRDQTSIPPSGFQPRNPRERADADPCFSPRGQRHRAVIYVANYDIYSYNKTN